VEKREILQNLKELTLDFFEGRRTREETVHELYKRMSYPEDFDEAADKDEFIQRVYWDLRHLTHEKPFETKIEEIQYFMECFEGKRTYSIEDWNNYLHEKMKGK